MESKPTHEQAQLHLQLYEERREPRLRQARDWFWANCYADTLDEAMRIAPPGTEAGTSFMMVISYWDQACALLNYGLAHSKTLGAVTSDQPRKVIESAPGSTDNFAAIRLALHQSVHLTFAGLFIVALAIVVFAVLVPTVAAARNREAPQR